MFKIAVMAAFIGFSGTGENADMLMMQVLNHERFETIEECQKELPRISKELQGKYKSWVFATADCVPALTLNPNRKEDNAKPKAVEPPQS